MMRRRRPSRRGRRAGSRMPYRSGRTVRRLRQGGATRSRRLQDGRHRRCVPLAWRGRGRWSPAQVSTPRYQRLRTGWSAPPACRLSRNAAARPNEVSSPNRTMGAWRSARSSERRGPEELATVTFAQTASPAAAGGFAMCEGQQPRSAVAGVPRHRRVGARALRPRPIATWIFWPAVQATFLSASPSSSTSRKCGESVLMPAMRAGRISHRSNIRVTRPCGAGDGSGRLWLGGRARSKLGSSQGSPPCRIIWS